MWDKVRCALKSHGNSSSRKSKVRVCCRVKRADDLLSRGQAWVKSCGSSRTITLHHPGTNDQTFTFDQVFGPDCTQQALYESAAEELVVDVMSGYNATLLAYGQSGSGKTFTMESTEFSARTKCLTPAIGPIEAAPRNAIGQGNSSFEMIAKLKHNRCVFRKQEAIRAMRTFTPDLPADVHSSDSNGLIPRCVAALFDKIGQTSAGYENTFEVKVSYVELYQEKSGTC